MFPYPVLVHMENPYRDRTEQCEMAVWPERTSISTSPNSKHACLKPRLAQEQRVKDIEVTVINPPRPGKSRGR
jgi:hypothetical protein